MPNPIIHVRVPDYDRDMLKLMAKTTGKDLSDVVREAIDSYLRPARGGEDSPPVLLHCLVCGERRETAAWGLGFTAGKSGKAQPHVIFECADCGAYGQSMVKKTDIGTKIPREQPGRLREKTSLSWREAVEMVSVVAGEVQDKALKDRNHILGLLGANGISLASLSELTGLEPETLRRIVHPYEVELEEKRRQQGLSAAAAKAGKPKPKRPRQPKMSPAAAARSRQQTIDAHRANDAARRLAEGRQYA